MQWSNPPRSNFLCSITAGLLGPGVVISSLVWMTPAIAQQVLSSWQYDPLTQQFTVTLPQGVTPQYSVLAEAGQIRLDLPQTQLGAVPTDATYQGVVRQISLSQLNDETVRVVFTLDPGVELEGDPLQLVAVAAGDQTRWVFSPLAHRAEPRGRAETVPGGMIVELPTLPPDPNLSWPYTGIGRLSISATNLMLPETLDSFNNLPETLAIDPFNLGLPAGDPVSVPSLAELDAAIGVAIAPSTSATANGTAGAAIALPPPLDRPGPGNPVAVAPLPNPAEGAEVTPPVATEPRPEPMSSVALTPPPRSTPVIETPPGLAPAPTPAPFRPEVAPLPETALAPTLAQPALEQPTIDQDQGGLAIPVTPPVPATRPLSPPATPEVRALSNAAFEQGVKAFQA
ncbi:MAG TPA: AMIN domain-containing protein, partial [Leptolyngbyaceae cyanobacterium M65_K2018_010]|nr:AMIN domain-containing protein [Leptolyngbyaceae cyanobacterium M65_K2018_010]